jgi:hypothetical protein
MPPLAEPGRDRRGIPAVARLRHAGGAERRAQRRAGPRTAEIDARSLGRAS